MWSRRCRWSMLIDIRKRARLSCLCGLCASASERLSILILFVTPKLPVTWDASDVASDRCTSDSAEPVSVMRPRSMMMWMAGTGICA